MINTILLGVQKAGTTSFYNWLGQHPDIQAPEEMKDFHFFTMDKYFKRGYDSINAYYSNEKSIRIKGAVNYIMFPKAAERLYVYNPDLKFILILRNPVERALSAYNYFYKLGLENSGIEEALERELTGKLTTDLERANFAYLEHGLYHKQISTYLKYFRRDQFMIILYEDMVADKTEVIKQVYEFLSVDSLFIPSFNHFNQTGEVKVKILNKLVFQDNIIKNILKPLINMIPLSSKILFGNMLREVNTKNKTSSKRGIFPEKYKGYFEEDVQSLSQLLNRDMKQIWRF